MVNQTFARRTFPGEEALGKRILTIANQIGPLGRNLLAGKPFRIVGVIADIQQAPIGRRGEPVIYHTQRQFPFKAMTIAGRGPDTAAVVTGLRAALKSLDASLAFGIVRTMDERFVAATAGPRLLTGVLVTFAVLTAMLAAIGVYGLLAWTVNERRRELAIRLALGAQPGALARLVTAQGLMLALLGVDPRPGRRAIRAWIAARRAVRDAPHRPPRALERRRRPGAGCRRRLPSPRAPRDTGESYGGDEVTCPRFAVRGFAVRRQSQSRELGQRRCHQLLAGPSTQMLRTSA